MNWYRDYIAVDWGSTNRRAYRIECGRTLGTLVDGSGVLAVPPGGFDRAIAQIRNELGDVPILLAGMVGSSRGWREAPYVECPAGPSEIAARILWIDARTGILPGVCQRGDWGPDVMRGEEVQLVGGVAAGLVSPTGIVCHPGTHAKWAELEAGKITRFQTTMTGELFALLRQYSILAENLAGNVAVGAQFDAGVIEVLGGEPLLSALFRIRARSLLEGQGADAASRTSGILIGSDVMASVRASTPLQVSIMGQPELCELYARALALAGHQSSIVDGPAAFLAGVAAVANCL